MLKTRLTFPQKFLDRRLSINIFYMQVNGRLHNTTTWEVTKIRVVDVPKYVRLFLSIQRKYDTLKQIANQTTTI